MGKIYLTFLKKIALKKQIIGLIMVDENSSNSSVSKFDILDSERVVNIWKECGLGRDWNNTELDIKRKLSFQKKVLFVGEREN